MLLSAHVCSIDLPHLPTTVDADLLFWCVGRRLAESSGQTSSDTAGSCGGEGLQRNYQSCFPYCNKGAVISRGSQWAPTPPASSSSSSECSSPSRIPFSSTCLSASSALLPLPSDQHFLPDSEVSRVTVYAAMFKNGSMLGLKCSLTSTSKSKPASSLIPAPLHPTPLQLTTVHLQWIDRFPFPRMRDNMIILAGIIDDEEFMGDLFCSSYKPLSNPPLRVMLTPTSSSGQFYDPV